MEPVFCSIQHPDLAGFLRWKNCGLGTHPMLAAQNQATSTRVSISAPAPWRCHPCIIPLLFGNQEHLLNRTSLPVFQSPNTLHGNQIQRFMQLPTFSKGQYEFTKTKGKPRASFDCWAHHLSTTFGTHVWVIGPLRSGTKPRICRTCGSFPNSHSQLFYRTHRLFLPFLSSEKSLPHPSY